MLEFDDFVDATAVHVRRPTGWHSAAASAARDDFKKRTISRAKRSAAMPGWAIGLLNVSVLLA
jgi:hypothetical protein